MTEAQLQSVTLLVDSWVKQRRHLARCEGAGCCACCRGELVGNPLEAVVMLKALWRRHRESMRSFLPEDPLTAVCPLLKDGYCVIYRARPIVCRSRLVINPPEVCDPIKTPGGETITIFDDRLAAMFATMAPTVPLLPLLRDLVLADDVVDAMEATGLSKPWLDKVRERAHHDPACRTLLFRWRDVPQVHLTAEHELAVMIDNRKKHLTTKE